MATATKKVSEDTHPCIKAIVENFDGPFEKPISFNRDTMELAAEAWMIKVYKLTKAGKISRSGGGYLTVTFCPLCGERLIPEKDND